MIVPSSRTSVDVDEAAVGTPDVDFRVRAERSGRGAGREYVATYSVTDAAGNVTVDHVRIRVAHDQGHD